MLFAAKLDFPVRHGLDHALAFSEWHGLDPSGPKQPYWMEETCHGNDATDIRSSAFVLSPHGRSVLVPVGSCRCCACGDPARVGAQSLRGHRQVRRRRGLACAGPTGLCACVWTCSACPQIDSLLASLVLGGRWTSCSRSVVRLDGQPPPRNRGSYFSRG